MIEFNVVYLTKLRFKQMEFIQYSPQIKLNDEILTLINNASERLLIKLKTLQLDQLEISAYYKTYLLKYINHFYYYARLYNQLFIKAFEVDANFTNRVIIDYGGGIGFLSLLALELGAKKVYYVDINNDASKAACVLGFEIGLKANDYLVGDLDHLIKELKSKEIHPDFVCSFDVIEHIYNPKEWMNKILTNYKTTVIVSMTSANGYNPFVNWKLKKYHQKAEYIGSSNQKIVNTRDTVLPFLATRRQIIAEFAPELSNLELDLLAKQTRGLFIDDIKEQLAIYKQKKNIHYRPKHMSNTCDPYTGNWVENIIDIKQLESDFNETQIKLEVIPTLYSPSQNSILNILKKVLNVCIEVLRKYSLYFSPGYILITQIRK